VIESAMIPALEDLTRVEEVVRVPGLGFLDKTAAEKLSEIFQGHLLHLDDLSNLTSSDLDRIRCEKVVVPHWQMFFPSLTDHQRLCLPTWDGASCIPPTPAGATAVFPCMSSAFGVDYSPEYNATKHCLANGSWTGPTNYLECLCMGSDEHTNTSTCTGSDWSDWSPTETDPNNELSVNIHIVGYTLSFLALVFAMTIYLSLREMRCLRHKIHLGLFSAFGLSAFNWILTLSWAGLVPPDLAAPLLCATFALTYFFHLTSFYWMFLEGLYLFLQVQYPLSLVSIKYKHFLIFGWGGPILNSVIWFGLRLQVWTEKLDDQPDFTTDQSQKESSCFLMDYESCDLWVMEMPMLIILAFNTFFLIWIISIVILKLKQRTSVDDDRRHWKATKALIFVMPLLGFGSVLTLVVKPAVASLGLPTATLVFNAVEAVIVSTQGFVISLPYCFLNSEVQGVLRSHWRRWWMVRSVGRASLSRNSLGTSSTYFVNQKTNLQA